MSIKYENEKNKFISLAEVKRGEVILYKYKFMVLLHEVINIIEKSIEYTLIDHDVIDNSIGENTPLILRRGILEEVKVYDGTEAPKVMLLANEPAYKFTPIKVYNITRKKE